MNNKIFVSNVNLNHFFPTYTWIDTTENFTSSKEEPCRSIKDTITGDLYLNESLLVTRSKCLGLSILSPIIHGILFVAQMIEQTIELLFDICNVFIGGYNNLSNNLYKVFEDLCKIIFLPLLVVALEFTAILGLIFPLNARKIFASIERLMINEFSVYKDVIKHDRTKHNFDEKNKFILAPCFQPKKFIDEETQNTGNKIKHPQ